MDGAAPLLIEQHGHVLRMTFNRPDRLNALDLGLQQAIQAGFRQADADPSVRAIVVTGAGRAFCAGADMSRLEASASGRGDEAGMTRPRFTARQLGIFKPTICAVNGVCAGAGLHYVADSDIVIASDAASFVDTHVNVGQVAGLEPIGLLRHISLQSVLRMVILGREERLDARRALAIGLVSEVLPPERLVERAMELGEIASRGSPQAVQHSIRAIWESSEMPLDQAYDNAFELILAHKRHPDAAEGPRAFMEKRVPNWRAD